MPDTRAKRASTRPLALCPIASAASLPQALSPLPDSEGGKGTLYNARVPRFNSLEPRLHIAEFNRSVAFYRDVLGFEVLSTFPEENPSFALLARDGVGLQIGGIDTTKSPVNPPTVTLYFDVGDAMELFEELKGKVAIEWGPEVFFYQRREFAFRDPDRHLVIISEETDDPVTALED